MKRPGHVCFGAIKAGTLLPKACPAASACSVKFRLGLLSYGTIALGDVRACSTQALRGSAGGALLSATIPERHLVIQSGAAPICAMTDPVSTCSKMAGVVRVRSSSHGERLKVQCRRSPRHHNLHTRSRKLVCPQSHAGNIRPLKGDERNLSNANKRQQTLR